MLNSYSANGNDFIEIELKVFQFQQFEVEMIQMNRAILRTILLEIDDTFCRVPKLEWKMKNDQENRRSDGWLTEHPEIFLKVEDQREVGEEFLFQCVFVLVPVSTTSVEMCLTNPTDLNSSLSFHPHLLNWSHCFIYRTLIFHA